MPEGVGIATGLIGLGVQCGLHVRGIDHFAGLATFSLSLSVLEEQFLLFSRELVQHRRLIGDQQTMLKAPAEHDRDKQQKGCRNADPKGDIGPVIARQGMHLGRRPAR